MYRVRYKERGGTTYTAYYYEKPTLTDTKTCAFIVGVEGVNRGIDIYPPEEMKEPIMMSPGVFVVEKDVSGITRGEAEILVAKCVARYKQELNV